MAIGVMLLAAALLTSVSEAQEGYKVESIVGIGATLEKLEDGTVRVNRLIPKAPAERFGLVAGDLILQVKSLPTTASVSVINMALPDVVALIRGPVGVPVEILVKRGTIAEAVIVIVREKFEVSED